MHGFHLLTNIFCMIMNTKRRSEEPTWEEITSLTTLEAVTLKTASNNCFYRKVMTHTHQLYLCAAVPLCEQFCYTKFRVTAQFVLQHKFRVCCHYFTQVGSSRRPKQCFMCFIRIHFLASVFKISTIRLFYLLDIKKKVSVFSDQMSTATTSC